MNSQEITLAPGELQIAAVMILDLVKHAGRSKEDSQRIQAIVEDVFARSVKNLNISDEAIWRYTGDGYVCTFLGRAAGRLLDFLNASIATIIKQLEAYAQPIRVGVDYGLVQMFDNQLTLCKEHFDQPGIQAARLESVAGANEVLCSATVYQIFQPLYPGSFDQISRRVQSKDRTLEAYVYRPEDLSQIRYLISRLFYGSDGLSDMALIRPIKILIVDDEPWLRDLLLELLKIDKHEAVEAENGESALQTLKNQKFDLIITDLMMPGMNGEEFARAAKCLCPMTPVLLITGHIQWILNKNEPLSAVDLLLAKPFSVHEFRRALFWVMAVNSNPAAQQVHYRLCRGGVILRLNAAIDAWQSIVGQMSGPNDLAHIMVRHKAKHLVAQYIDSLQPGGNVVESTLQFWNQLHSLRRITNRVQSAQGKEYIKYITEVVADLKKEHKGIRVKCKTGTRVQTLLLNQQVVALLSLIVCELIDNAVEALGGKGKVDIHIDILSTKQALYIEVKDSGAGLKTGSELLAFSENFSTRGPGRGLGLFLVKEGIAKLGGTIEYKYETGAIFKVSVPIHDLAIEKSIELRKEVRNPKSVKRKDYKHPLAGNEH